MKNLWALMFAISTTAVSAQSFDNVSRQDLEKVGNEFTVNFSHTVVAAPETDGLWGLEVGLLAGQTGSPGLKKVVDDSGENGDDFKNIYHAGIMARVHFPLELFVELALLPEQKVSDLNVSSRSLGLGWNAGAFFKLPLDLAVGVNLSDSDTSFSQIIQNTSTGNIPVNSTINHKGQSQVYWLGVSKTFAIFTPYAKVGMASTSSDFKVNASNNGTIFGFSKSQEESVSSNGGYAAIGANLQLLLFRLGLEASQTIDVKRVSGKLSIAF